MDLTKSIRYKNLRKIRESLKQFVKRFKIGPADTHVSLETFAGDSTLHNKFNDKAYHSEQALVGLIDSKLRGLTMPTRLDKALSMEDRIMFSSVNGHRVDVQSVNIVITDGKTNPASKDFSSAVKSLKVIYLSSFVIFYYFTFSTASKEFPIFIFITNPYIVFYCPSLFLRFLRLRLDNCGKTQESLAIKR